MKLWTSVIAAVLVVALGEVVHERKPKVDVVNVVLGRDNARAMEQMNGFFVDLLLARINGDSNNYITRAEFNNFWQSLDSNRDLNTERCEFVSQVGSQFNISLQTAIFLYEIIDLSDNETDTFRFDETSQGQILPEFREAALTEVYRAALAGNKTKDIKWATDETSSELNPSGLEVAQRLDTDGNGQVSVDEHMASFSGIDVDGDGLISRCEWQNSQRFTPGFNAIASSLINAFVDNDGDGNISRDEYLAILVRADVDHDNHPVSLEEYAKFHDMMQKAARRQAGVPVRAKEFHCAWASSFNQSSEPDFDVKTWILDADDDDDDVISPYEHCKAMHALRNAGYVDSRLVNGTNGSITVTPLGSKELATRYNISREDVTAISSKLNNRTWTACKSDVIEADKNGDGKTSTCEMLYYVTILMKKLESGEMYNTTRPVNTTVSPPPYPVPIDNIGWVMPSDEGLEALKEKVNAILTESASSDEDNTAPRDFESLREEVDEILNKPDSNEDDHDGIFSYLKNKWEKHHDKN